MGPFAGKLLREVTLADIQRLIDNAVSESSHLEYKRELNLDDQDKKKEFLRDVSAFANAEGGTIIIGVEEDRSTGLPKAITGLAVANADDLLLRVNNIIKDGIDERLPSCETRVLPLQPTSGVLLVNIRQSIRAPHMVILGGERRFYVRANNARQEMSTAQIRDAVLRTDSIGDRVQKFVQGRLAKWQETPLNLPFWLLHIIPLVRDAALDLTDEALTRRLTMMRWPMGSNYPVHCLEGFKVPFVWERVGNKITQRITFRDGTVELLDQYVFKDRSLDGITFTRIVRETVESVLDLYRDGTLHPPLAICLSMCGAKGYEILDLPMNPFRAHAALDQDQVVVDPLVLTEIPQDVAIAVRPAVNIIWNAFGYASSEGYQG